MNCDKYDDLIHRSIDGELNQAEQSVLDAHLDTCEECMMKYQELKLMKEVLSEESLLELPKGFEEELHEKLLMEEAPKKVSFFRRRIVQNSMVGALAAALVFTIMLPSIVDNMPRLTNGKGMTMEMASDDAYGVDGNYADEPMMAPPMEMTEEAPEVQSFDMADAEAVSITFNEAGSDAKRDLGDANFTVTATSVNMEQENATSETDNLDVNERKVIKNGELSLDITDYDQVYESIVMMTQDAGGYVENSNEWLQRYNRHSEEDPLKAGTVRLRVPADTFSLFLEQMKAFGVVTNSHTYASDVSYQYRNAVSEVQNLEVTERSLRALMEKAEDIDDIIYIERELMRVRSDINMYMGSIKKWDDLASMSTLMISLNEVEVLDGEIKPVDDSLWAKAQRALIDNLNGLTRFGEGLFIWLIATLPMLVVFGISVYIVYRILMWITKKIFK